MLMKWLLLLILVVGFANIALSGNITYKFATEKTEVTEPSYSSGVLPITITIERSGDIANASNASLFTAGTADIPSDYTLTSSTLIQFPAGSKSSKFSLNIMKDSCVETLETIAIHFEKKLNSSALFGSPDVHTVSITDDGEDDNFYMATSTVSLLEKDEPGISLTVKRSPSGKINKEVILQLDTTFVSAQTADLKDLTSTILLTFSPTVTSRTAQIGKVVNDKLAEGLESFQTKLSVKTQGILPVCLTKTKTTFKIRSDDVKFSCVGTKVSEGAGKAKVSLTRVGKEAITDYSDEIWCFTKEGTAVPALDYTPDNAKVTLAKTKSIGYYEVAITNDEVVENEESLYVKCFIDSNFDRVIVDSSCDNVEIKITNDDTYLFFCPDPVLLIPENNGKYNVDICRFGLTTAVHSFTACFTGDSNPEPSFASGCQLITFKTDETRKTVSYNITDDIVGEKELVSFTVSLSPNSSDVTFNGSSSIQVTVQEDDMVFYFDTNTTITVNESSGALKVLIKRDGKLSVPVDVSLELDFGSGATAESADCTGSNTQTISFIASETQKEVTACTIVDDDLVEPKQNFFVKLKGKSGSIVKEGLKQRTVEIISRDVDVTCSSVNVKEDVGIVALTLNRTGATEFAHDVITCKTNEDSANNPSDYVTNSTNITFNEFETSKTWNIAFVKDRIPEKNDNLTITCTASDTDVHLLSCTDRPITVINDDTYIFFCPPYNIYRRESSGTINVDLCRVGVIKESHNVTLCWSSDTNGLQYDYPSITANCTDITFAANDVRKTPLISIFDDKWGEQEYKTINIELKTNDSRVTLNGSSSSYNLRLHDDDNSFCISQTLKYNEENHKYENITIKRWGAISTTNASISVTSSQGDASHSEDYNHQNNILHFGVNETEKTMSIEIIDDRHVEVDQMFYLSLTGQNGSTVFNGCENKTVTISSNDVNISCEFSTSSQNEDNSPVTVVFNRTGSLQYNHTFRIQTVDGTAKANSDYLPFDKVLTFSPNQAQIKYDITFVKDVITEPDESLRIDVTSSDQRVNIMCPRIDLNIMNDDTILSCLNSSITAFFGATIVNFMIKREGNLKREAEIWYSTIDGTAYDKVDYKPVIKQNLTFQSDQVYMNLSVEIFIADIKDGNEDFSVVIGSDDPNIVAPSNCTNIIIMENPLSRISGQQSEEQRRQLLKIAMVLAVILLVILLLVALVLAYICCIRKYKNDANLDGVIYH